MCVCVGVLLKICVNARGDSSQIFFLLLYYIIYGYIIDEKSIIARRHVKLFHSISSITVKYFGIDDGNIVEYSFKIYNYYNIITKMFYLIVILISLLMFRFYNMRKIIFASNTLDFYSRYIF